MISRRILRITEAADMDSFCSSHKYMENLVCFRHWSMHWGYSREQKRQKYLPSWTLYHGENESVVIQLCPTLCHPMDCSLPGSSVYWDSPDKNAGVGCHILLQGIFLTQGWNSCLLCLLHWQMGS